LIRSRLFRAVFAVTWISSSFLPLIRVHSSGELKFRLPLYYIYMLLLDLDYTLEALAFVAAHVAAAAAVAALVWRVVRWWALRAQRS